MPGLPPLQLNPLDAIVALVVLLYALSGARDGWLRSTLDLLGVIAALLASLRFHAWPARLALALVPLPYTLAKPLAFLFLWAVLEFAFGSALRALLGRRRRPRGLDAALGLLPGAARGLVLTAVLLTIAGTVPFPEPIAVLLRSSRAQQALQPGGTVLTEQISQIFGDAIQETITLLTIKPESDERVRLPFRVSDPVVDPSAEDEMLRLLNAERTSRGLRPLNLDPLLREAARGHSRDMFENSYFGHLDLAGGTPAERLRAVNARFRLAGENLALAPTVEVAHNGLMNSPGHRANILNPSFGRVGIGVVDGGLHGKMFTQNFAD